MSEDTETCRHCKRALRGTQNGRDQWVPGTETRSRPSGIRALWHFYGGWVCSRQCNRGVFATMRNANVWSSDDAQRMRDGDDYFANA